MKKFFTLAICFFCGILLSQAQISRGTTYINPQISGFNISGTDNNKSKKDKFNFALDIKGGNFISDNLAVIVGLGMDLESQEKYRNSKIDVSAGFRYYTLTTLFIGRRRDMNTVGKGNLIRQKHITTIIGISVPN